MTEISSSDRDAGRDPKRLPPEAKPQRGPEHEKLAVFLGDWRGKGTGGAGSDMTTVETYDWVDGKFFLETHFDQKVGEASHIGVGTIGYDPDTRAYRLHMVDNLGYHRDYAVRDDGNGVWRFLGERERAALTFKGDEMNVRWEHRPDGGEWAPLCEFNSVNARKRAVH
ncbi:DUF1579 family protein [Phenylobacterium sp.]|uniref:DUF1579 family protein n=1 Tax=Phenylobacterium sp. TaxID=1871053 RepID=UPI003565F147